MVFHTLILMEMVILIDKKNTAAYLKLYLEDNNISVNEFAAKVGASPSSVYYWLSGKKLPLSVYFEKMKDLFAPYELFIGDEKSIR